MGAVQTIHTSAGADYFESVYRSAGGEASLVPWCDGRASKALVNWLNVVAPSLVRCGSRVAVVGCGAGDDARELLRRGYEVTAFDVSPSAIKWAKSLDPANERCYVCADLFEPSPRWRHRFDLVVEVNNLAWLEPKRWSMAMRSIGELLTPHGHLLVISPSATQTIPVEAGPPWPMIDIELLKAAALAGLSPVGNAATFADDDDSSQLRIRALFKRG